MDWNWMNGSSRAIFRSVRHKMKSSDHEIFLRIWDLLPRWIDWLNEMMWISRNPTNNTALWTYRADTDNISYRLPVFNILLLCHQFQKDTTVHYHSYNHQLLDQHLHLIFKHFWNHVWTRRWPRRPHRLFLLHVHRASHDCLDTPPRKIWKEEEHHVRHRFSRYSCCHQNWWV